MLAVGADLDTRKLPVLNVQRAVVAYWRLASATVVIATMSTQHGLGYRG